MAAPRNTETTSTSRALHWTQTVKVKEDKPSYGLSLHRDVSACVCLCVGHEKGHIKLSHSSTHRHNIELLLFTVSTVTASSAHKLIALKNNAPLKGLQHHLVELNATFLHFFLLSAMSSDGATKPKLRFLLKCINHCFSLYIYIDSLRE